MTLGLDQRINSRFNLNSTQKLFASLLFLAPIFAVSVRHWISAIYVLLGLISLFFLAKSWRDLRLDLTEKALFLALIGYFLVFLLSSLLNTWDEGSWRMLEREARYLFLIPIYLYLRSNKSATLYFGAGCLVGIVLNAVLVLVQSTVIGYGNDLGTYGPLFTGPVTILMLTAATLFIEKTFSANKAAALVLLVTLLAVFIAIQTSRSSLLGLLVWIAIYFLLISKLWRMRLLMLAMLCLVVLFFSQLNIVGRSGFDTAYNETKNYLNFLYERPGEVNPHAMTSVGTRLEMLRTLPLFIRDYPFFGVGSYNYNGVVKKYVATENISPSVAMHGHPHNVFAEVLISKGLLGFFFFALIWVSALRQIIAQNRWAEESRWYPVGFLLALFAMMLTESAIATKGNFIACALLFLAVFMNYRNDGLRKNL